MLVGEDARHRGKMRWRAQGHGRMVIYKRDPDATMMLRLEVKMLRLLPIESMR